jgi:ethanolamine utilization microcompartment shell protein EutL
VFRVTYYLRGQPAQAFVCAFTGSEASAFLGVTDGSATASSVAHPVEIAGLDSAHDALPALKVTMAEPAPPAQFSHDEMKRLRALLAGK